MTVLHKVVVMGVSGCGKSMIAQGLSDATGLRFLDGDSLHPATNIAKMSAGHPLDDADRAPWLDAVGAALAGRADVVACSALKRAYRDRIRVQVPDAVFVHLDGPRDVLAARVGGRPGHFMPADLLDSQLATLEPLQADEAGIVVDLDQTPDRIVATIRRRIVTRGQSETT